MNIFISKEYAIKALKHLSVKHKIVIKVHTLNGFIPDSPDEEMHDALSEVVDSMNALDTYRETELVIKENES